MLNLILFAAAVAAVPSPIVPGGCTAPASEHLNEAGCYLLAEMSVEHAPKQVYWHIFEFPDVAAAETEARKHRWSKVVSAHASAWLYVIGERKIPVSSGKPSAIIGPMDVPSGNTVSVRFLTSTFPPGMRTRIHSHPGSEAFYVIEGEQCVETPTGRHRITAGHSYIVQSGIHVQAAARGRKSLVALILPPGVAWSEPDTSWNPSQYCHR
ncbi:MAG: cupin domain-containing protein [Pseudomonadota bacterium]|jgi:quercetin dioxygenase-like cupin family protein